MKTFLKVVLVVFVLVATGYNTRTFSTLSHRLDKVETRLGGPSKLGYNEKDTVQKVRRSVVLIIGGESEGSGFAVRKDGYILTNFHVIAFELCPKIILPDGTFETGKVIMADKDTDLAVIKIEKDLPVLSLMDLKKLEPAEELLAVGYAMGGDLPGAVQTSVGQGLFSSRRMSKEDNVEYIQTNITFVPGMSGGPMVNIRGEVVGVNTAGFILGGMGLSISADTVRDKWKKMTASKDPLKDVQRIEFKPNENPLEAVKAFYNYLKVRKLEKAFALLSDNFVKGYTFEQWAKGYEPLLDTSILEIKPDKKVENRIRVKLSTKDLVDSEVKYKLFEGWWDVRKVDGKWLLWQPRIREVKDPTPEWFPQQTK